MKRRRQLPLKRKQFRVTIDEGMGEIWEWVESLKPGVAPREILAAARMGVAIARGGLSPRSAAPSTALDAGMFPTNAEIGRGGGPLPGHLDENMASFKIGGGSLLIFEGPPEEA